MLRPSNHQTSMQIRMYGCTESELRANLRDLCAWHHGSGTISAISMLSDVQEMILLNKKEDARKLINRVKYLIDNYLTTLPGEAGDER